MWFYAVDTGRLKEFKIAALDTYTSESALMKLACEPLFTVHRYIL